MATTTFSRVRRLIDQLTPIEQVHLLEYLTPRIVRAIATMQPVTTPKSVSLAAAWQTFFRIGDELAESDQTEMPTLTQAVQTMRR